LIYTTSDKEGSWPEYDKNRINVNIAANMKITHTRAHNTSVLDKHHLLKKA